MTNKKGKFALADGGTIFLDEIGTMSLTLQSKLLRVLQEREVERLGGRGPLALDVRVLATTNRDLRAEVAANRFREDLYYRLNVFPLATLPLRARRDDILPLAMKLLASRCRAGERIPAVSADAAHLLLTYPWPGNVRELDNVMQRALILASDTLVDKEHIHLEDVIGGRRTADGDGAEVTRDSRATGCKSASAPSGSSLELPAEQNGESALASSLSAAEHDLILDALRADNGNREAVARRLGISPRTLRYKLARMREAGVEV
jgi:two-component system response regulator FlrC